MQTPFWHEPVAGAPGRNRRAIPHRNPALASSRSSATPPSAVPARVLEAAAAESMGGGHALRPGMVRTVLCRPPLHAIPVIMNGTCRL